ncbi:TolC family protein [Halodesulfovibrio marinisediminis]|uniref:Outer membrane protein TolC n=1 Tax=Halodesulfovibrio marinisediminis DSM 17456 TaxID=1121457 RepID=A0A1N6DXS4_9BACT|nr:TolC family protein [Halodesulfovibrio marinisediminis]SIN75504.1 Outer membrane protein TolC [Halodesulfovibrio marinisediminis DSM 17456]
MVLRFFFAVGLLLFAVGDLYAVDEQADPLPSYLKIAAENNGELQAAFSKWKAALQKAPQVSTLPDPQLSFGVYIVPVETRVGPQRMSYGLTQKFPWLGKLGAKEKVALREADVLKARTDSIKTRIFRDVKVGYYELLYLQRAIQLTGEQIELLEFMEATNRARYSAGNAPYADVLRTQVELDSTRNRKASLKDMFVPLQARLNAAMGRDIEEPVHLSDVVELELGVEGQELKTLLANTNPELLSFDQQLASADAQITLAEKNYYPDLTFGIKSIYTDKARSGDPSQNGDDPVIASVSLNIPIWQDSRDAAVEEGREKRLVAIKAKKGRKDTLLADLELTLYRYRDAVRQIVLYDESLIPKAEQSVEVSLEAYQSGEVDLQQVIAAEKTYFELHIAQARALTDQAQRIAQLEQLVGKELPVMQKSTTKLTGLSLLQTELNVTIE